MKTTQERRGKRREEPLCQLLITTIHDHPCTNAGIIGNPPLSRYSSLQESSNDGQNDSEADAELQARDTINAQQSSRAIDSRKIGERNRRSERRRVLAINVGGSSGIGCGGVLAVDGDGFNKGIEVT